ncbi:hypothetical protein D6777_01735 [Candidatus Woesearchaeota archaeon]|nr:MAG: hypothetical protein D6777_01735 [Candidatus Woesearchaeota archaeon]
MLSLIMALLGILYAVVGATATLANLNVNVFMLPSLFYTPIATKIALAIGAIMLFIASWLIKDMNASLDWSLIITSIIFLPIGTFPLLQDYNFFNMLPFTLKLDLPNIVYSVMLFLFGIFLIFWTVKMRRSSMFFG